MDAIRNLDINDPAAKYAVAALLGATLSELKTIDRAIVGGSKNIAAAKPDLTRIFGAAPDQTTGTTQTISNVQPTPHVPLQPTVIPPAPRSQESVPQEDPNQLVFDFNKPITPESINSKLDTIIEKLNRVIELLKKD